MDDALRRPPIAGRTDVQESRSVIPTPDAVRRRHPTGPWAVTVDGRPSVTRRSVSRSRSPIFGPASAVDPVAERRIVPSASAVSIWGACGCVFPVGSIPPATTSPLRSINPVGWEATRVEADCVTCAQTVAWALAARIGTASAARPVDGSPRGTAFAPPATCPSWATAVRDHPAVRSWRVGAASASPSLCPIAGSPAAAPICAAHTVIAPPAPAVDRSRPSTARSPPPVSPWCPAPATTTRAVASGTRAPVGCAPTGCVGSLVVATLTVKQIVDACPATTVRAPWCGPAFP